MTKEIDGITFEIAKKDVKRINVRIYPNGPIRVSAPKYMGKKEVLRFLEEKIDRIKTAQSRLSEKQEAQEFSLSENNGSVLLFGKPYELKFQTEPPFGVCTENETLTVSTKTDSETEREKTLAAFLKTRLENELSFFVQKWENVTDLHCSEWKIKKVKSYWGKCKTGTGVLTFNFNLVHFPLEEIEYVVLHEIAHLKYPNHQEGFKTFLSKYMTDWKVRAAKLK